MHTLPGDRAATTLLSTLTAAGVEDIWFTSDLAIAALTPRIPLRHRLLPWCTDADIDRRKDAAEARVLDLLNDTTRHQGLLNATFFEALRVRLTPFFKTHALVGLCPRRYEVNVSDPLTDQVDVRLG